LERDFQSSSDCFKLADMYVKATAKLLVMKAACEKMKVKTLHILEQWQIICFRNCFRSNEAVQIHGGNGYVAEYHVVSV
jgi:alkylation response protein AidB-like acyl-CoA dehydrogenase